ncbi:MAG: hypothetical protein LAO55_25855, partial [Acidobacteriia bacterium]|nr:hypothetical protein [Terriglobia bacterium]
QAAWFPLQPGLRWVYSVESGIGGTRTVKVVRAEGNGYVVDFNGTEVTVDLGYDIELPGEGPVPYYRFELDSQPSIIVLYDRYQRW